MIAAPAAQIPIQPAAVGLDGYRPLLLYTVTGYIGAVAKRVNYNSTFNNITVIHTGGSGYAPTVSVSGRTMTVTLANKGTMLVTGTLTSNGVTPFVMQNLRYNYMLDGYPNYYAGDEDNTYFAFNEPDDDQVRTWYMGYTDGNDEYQWSSTAQVASPDLVPAGAWHVTNNPTGWRPRAPATGTPVFTAAYTSAPMVAAAVNNGTGFVRANASGPDPAATGSVLLA